MDERPQSGVATELAAGLVRVLAPNPSPMTHWGTNSYLLGSRRLAVIDPGPDDPVHLEALLAAIAGREVSHIFVTHAHRDHSGLAPRLASAVRAPVLAYGRATAGRSAAMRALAEAGGAGGGEGIDGAFRPDVRLADGARVVGDGWEIVALHTPGHIGSHLVYLWGEAAFTGDHAMGWASTLISPPDGDVSDFLASSARFGASGARTYYPGHGAPVADGPARLDWLVRHRLDRGAAIEAALAEASGTAAEIAARVYRDVPDALLPAAERNALAHLLDLAARGRARPRGPISVDAVWEQCGHPSGRSESTLL